MKTATFKVTIRLGTNEEDEASATLRARYRLMDLSGVVKVEQVIEEPLPEPEVA